MSSVQSAGSAQSRKSALSESSNSSRKKRKDDEAEPTQDLCRQVAEINEIIEDIQSALRNRLTNKASKEKLDVMYLEVEKLKDLTPSLAMENSYLRGALHENKEISYSKALETRPKAKERTPAILVNKKK